MSGHSTDKVQKLHKLIILRGNSGSGKTTVAKELQGLFGRNTMLISQDVVRRDILYARDGKDSLALPLLKEMLRFGSEHSEITILEGILVAEWYKPLFELANKLYGSEIYAYYFDIPFEETLRRHQMKPNHHEFGEEEMRSWWKEKDYSDTLSEKTITSEKSKEDIVKEISEAVHMR